MFSSTYFSIHRYYKDVDVDRAKGNFLPEYREMTIRQRQKVTK